MERRGKQIEREIMARGTKEVENFGELDDEGKFGTAVPEKESESKSVIKDETDSLDELEKRSKNLQMNLMRALGGPTALKVEEKQSSATLKKDSNLEVERRSRMYSLRNGETSKVIENIDIEAPKMEKQQIEDFLRWKQSQK